MVPGYQKRVLDVSPITAPGPAFVKSLGRWHGRAEAPPVPDPQVRGPDSILGSWHLLGVRSSSEAFMSKSVVG